MYWPDLIPKPPALKPVPSCCARLEFLDHYERSDLPLHCLKLTPFLMCLRVLVNIALLKGAWPTIQRLPVPWWCRILLLFKRHWSSYLDQKWICLLAANLMLCMHIKVSWALYVNFSKYKDMYCMNVVVEVLMLFIALVFCFSIWPLTVFNAQSPATW